MHGSTSALTNRSERSERGARQSLTGSLRRVLVCYCDERCPALPRRQGSRHFTGVLQELGDWHRLCRLCRGRRGQGQDAGRHATSQAANRRCTRHWSDQAAIAKACSRQDTTRVQGQERVSIAASCLRQRRRRRRRQGRRTGLQQRLPACLPAARAARAARAYLFGIPLTKWTIRLLSPPQSS